MKYAIHTTVLCFVCASGATAEPPTYEQARGFIAGARAGLISSVVELEQTGGGGGPALAKQTWRIWWDEKRQRADFIPDGQVSPSRVVNCSNCERDGWGIEHNEEQNLLAAFKPLKSFMKGDFHYLRDPRTFGHSFGGLYQSGKGITALFPQTPPNGVTVETVPSPTGDLLRVSWPTGHQQHRYTITADPNRGYEVTLLESQNGAIRETVRTAEVGRDVVPGTNHV
jgi:hypothetical protein